MTLQKDLEGFVMYKSKQASYKDMRFQGFSQLNVYSSSRNNIIAVLVH